MKIHIVIFGLSLLLFSVALGGCAGTRVPAPISETRLLLDTVCTITIYDNQDRAILTKALDLCAEYESLFSITLEGSDIWRINHAGGAPVSVDPQTAELIRAGVEYGELSDGMFDITIGRLSTLWDFSGNSGVPSDADIELARGTVDYRQVVISGNTVQLKNSGTWIDLGGIAKGYIADRTADLLRVNGVRAAVIDLGGNIVTLGQKPDGSIWRVGVTDPFGERSDLIGVIETSGASVVSSGVYERRFVENGVLYHHILDPNTGMPVKCDVVGATVVTESSMDGDALSTIIVLTGINKPDGPVDGIERAASILDRQSGFIGAVIILDDGNILQHGDVNFKQ